MIVVLTECYHQHYYYQCYWFVSLTLSHLIAIECRYFYSSNFENDLKYLIGKFLRNHIYRIHSLQFWIYLNMLAKNFVSFSFSKIQKKSQLKWKIILKVKKVEIEGCGGEKEEEKKTISWKYFSANNDRISNIVVIHFSEKKTNLNIF